MSAADIAAAKRYRRSLAERIADLSRPADDGTDCVLWTGAKYPNGYGAIKVVGRAMPAHRAAVVADGRAIPDGMVVMHTCDRPLCVNPAHLVVGSVTENNRDAAAKRRVRNAPIRAARREAFDRLVRGGACENGTLTRAK